MIKIQWPQERKHIGCHFNSGGDCNCWAGEYNLARAECIQAAEKAIEDAEKEINRQEYIKAGEENLSKHGAVIESGIAQAFLNASLHNYKDGDKCATPKD